MSEGNVEVVRATMEAFNRGDVAAVLERLDENVELVPVRAVMEGSVYRGHDGFHRFVVDMTEDWDEYQPVPEEFRNLTEDEVLVSGRFCARSKTSGVEIDSPGFWLTKLRDGKIVQMRFYTDEAAAVEGAR